MKNVSFDLPTLKLLLAESEDNHKPWERYSVIDEEHGVVYQGTWGTVFKVLKEAIDSFGK